MTKVLLRGLPQNWEGHVLIIEFRPGMRKTGSRRLFEKLTQTVPIIFLSSIFAYILWQTIFKIKGTLLYLQALLKNKPFRSICSKFDRLPL